MTAKETTYLEKQTEATVTYEDETIEFIFHKAKVKLHDELEIHLLKSLNPEFNKSFKLTDDLLKISIVPPESYAFFKTIHKMSNESRWQLAYNLIQRIQQHSLDRLKLIVCPENIMFDHGLMPNFLHYGVQESIPPYEDEPERLWLETRAIIATIADDKFEFESYLSHYETIKLSNLAKQIMEASTHDQLIEIIEENLKKDKEYESTVVHIPAKKWKTQRYSILALIVFLVPALVYTIFAVFFKIPETQAYVDSNRFFLQNQFSNVVNTLDKYDHQKMPYGVQFQLASAYIANESLTEEQKKNVRNTITLQSDRKYFLYWIDIGRGNYQEAIDTARLLEDRDLIIFGLLKLREEIKTDQNLSGAEREAALDDVDKEIDEYKEEMEQEAAEQIEAEQQEGAGAVQGDEIESTDTTPEKEAEQTDTKQSDKSQVQDKDRTTDQKQ